MLHFSCSPLLRFFAICLTLSVGASAGHALPRTETMTVSIKVRDKTPVNGITTLTPVEIGTNGGGELAAEYTLPNNEVDRAADPNAHVTRTVVWTRGEM